MKIRFNIFIYLILPSLLKELYLGLLALKKFRLKVDITFIIFLLITLILTLKSLFVVSFDGVYISIKFFFLIVGIHFYRMNKSYWDHLKWHKTANLLLLIGVIVSIIIILGFDVWSGSGAYSVRPPSYFRGFGELALFLIFTTSFGGSFILILFLAVMSGSKTVILATIFAMLIHKPLKIAFAIFCIIFLLSTYSSFMLELQKEIEFVKQFYVSIINFSAESKGYTNRSEGTKLLLDMTRQNGYVLLVGIFENDLFAVWPEYGLAYLYKIGGLFLIILAFLYVYIAIGFSLSSLPLYLVLCGSAYALSPISFFLYGFLGSVLKMQKSKFSKLAY